MLLMMRNMSEIIAAASVAAAVSEQGYQPGTPAQQNDSRPGYEDTGIGKLGL